MATLFSFVRRFGKQKSFDQVDTSTHPNGFIPLNAEQMKRIKGGYEPEGDPGQGSTGTPDPDPNEDPLSGEPPIEEYVEE